MRKYKFKKSTGPSATIKWHDFSIDQPAIEEEHLVSIRPVKSRDRNDFHYVDILWWNNVNKYWVGYNPKTDECYNVNEYVDAWAELPEAYVPRKKDE